METIEKISEGIRLICEGFAESVIKAVTTFANSIPKVTKILNFYELDILNKAKNSTDSRKRKAYIIYRRTKNKRIRKKQLKIMEG